MSWAWLTDGGASAGFQSTLAASVSGIFNAKTYGYVGDGSTDDIAALDAAALAATGGILVIPEGTPLISRAFVVPSNIVIVAHSATFMPSFNGTAVYFDSPTLRTPTTTYAITADTVVGAYTFTSAAAAAALAVGDRITARDPVYDLGGEKVRRELNVVESIVGSTITVRHPIGHVYSAANGSWLAKVTMARNIHWYGGDSNMDNVAGGVAADCDFIEALYAEDCTVNDVNVFNQPDKGVSFYCPLNSKIRNCSDYSPDLVTAGEGYCMQIQYGRNSTMEGGWSENVRHHADIVGGQHVGIIGGHTAGRTTDDQVGAFIHGAEARWCYIKGFTAENVDVAAASGNGSFGADYDCTIEVESRFCDNAGWMNYGSTGTFKAKVHHSDAATAAITMTTPVGGRVDIEAEVYGVALRCVQLSGASTDQRVKLKARGTFGEQIFAEAGEFTVYDSDFDAAGTCVRAAVACAKVTILGPQKWGAGLRVSNTSGAIIAGARRDTEGTTIPTPLSTSQLHIVGDRHWKTDVAAAGSPGWVCTTASNPGPSVWKAMAAVAA